MAISFEADLNEVSALIIKRLSLIEELDKKENIDVYFLNYETYGIIAEVNFWIPYIEI